MARGLYDPPLMRSPRSFFAPLALGAPEPLREIPVKPSRMIHFLDFSNEKMVAKAADIATKTDILLGNLEDAVPVDRKEAAREGLIRVGKEMDLGETQLWTRVNSLESPWVLDDLTRIVTEVGDRVAVIMIPKVEGAWDIHYIDRLLAQLEAKAGLQRPILVHAILETSLGVTNLEEIAAASPRLQGMSFGPADLAASRRMKTTRVGGGHPGYRTIADPDPNDPEAPRASYQQDPWHYSIARMVDACTAVGILPFYGPYGDIKDVAGCETQFRAAFLLGCVGAWSLHPVQIEIAKKVFSPPPDEVKFAKKVLEAIPDGRGVHMIDGKIQDDPGIEEFAGDLVRSPALSGIVGFDRLEGGEHVVHGRKRKQPLAGGQVRAETRLLQDHRPSGRQVGGASLAEPAGSKANQPLVRDGEF